MFGVASADESGGIDTLMSPHQRRLLGYPLAVCLVAFLVWAAFFHRAEADFSTLVGSASVHAELAASIPADKAEGRAIRDDLITEARSFLERAERVEPGQSAACQVRAFLAMLEGDSDGAAALYAQSRTLPGCTDDQLGQLVMHEAKALSNAGRFGDALGLLDDHRSERREEDVFAWDALRVRILFRSGDLVRARSEAVLVAGLAASGSDECLTAASLLEGLGELTEAEASYRKAGLSNELQNYVSARLKLRAGETDRASSLLRQSVETGDPEVLEQVRLDEELWINGLGAEGFRRLTTSTGEPSTPGVGR